MQLHFSCQLQMEQYALKMQCILGAYLDSFRIIKMQHKKCRTAYLMSSTKNAECILNALNSVGICLREITH